MIKQYISSRLQNRSNGAFGCIDSKGNILPDQAKQLDRFAAAYGTELTDRNGARIPITMKFAVGKDGTFAVGRNSFVDGKKPTHISHQFLFENSSTLDLVVSPDEIMRLPFISDELDCAALSDAISLTGSPMPVKELSAAMRLWGIDADMFFAIVTAAYDCIANSRKIIIALDGVFDDYAIECTSLLYHIYRYLPYQMRMLMGFDTCYSYITSKGCIHISFVPRDTFAFADNGSVFIGERDCTFDYILLDGKLLHTADKSDIKCGMLLCGLKKYINKEFDGISCEKQLTEVFDSLYSLSRGIPFGFFDNSVVYDAMFAAMAAVAGNKVTRRDADALLRFYIAVCARLDGDAADFWGNAVYSYLNDYEVESDDAYILTVLAAIYCSADQIQEYILSMLQQKLIKAVKSEGVSAIKRFDIAIASADSDGSFYLARHVFSVMPQTQKAFISFKLDECVSAGEICTATALLARALCCDSGISTVENEITSAALSRVHNMRVNCDDIIVMQRLLSNEIQDNVRSVIHRVADGAMDIIDCTDLDPSWFMSIKLGGDFAPATFGGVAAMLLHDILVDPSSCDILHYLSKYTYLSAEIRIKAGAAAGDILVAMLTDGRLALMPTLYPIVMLLTRDDNAFDFDLISKILARHPAQTVGYIRYFGTKLGTAQDPSACFARFLQSIKSICTDANNALDPKAIIVAVNDVRKTGIKCKEADGFNAAVYDAYNLHKSYMGLLIGKLVRRSALLANSKSKSDSKYYAIIAGAIIFGIVLIILLSVAESRNSQRYPEFELYSGSKKIEFVEYSSDQTDAAERIKLAENIVNTDITFSDTITLKISDGNVKFLEYTQKNLLAGAQSYTIGDFSNMVGNDDGVFAVSLTNVTSDLHRVYICFDVRYQDGKRICYGVCLQR